MCVCVCVCDARLCVSDAVAVKPVDVVITGLNAILMTEDILKVHTHTHTHTHTAIQCTHIHVYIYMLLYTHTHTHIYLYTLPPLLLPQFPSLCQQFYTLVNYICESFPERLPSLPDKLFLSRMHLLESGLHDYGVEVTTLCHAPARVVSMTTVWR